MGVSVSARLSIFFRSRLKVVQANKLNFVCFSILFFLFTGYVFRGGAKKKRLKIKFCLKPSNSISKSGFCSVDFAKWGNCRTKIEPLMRVS